ncbi:hypothetical protein [Streptomyces sp. CMB-StM0423]|uniref:hypothetical protein n=1 Tax=Streptomyces sp. CMB-StM0423 TaxID=2059884 RepID=UPI000C700EBE|nr:hypothetical protein [Streptomyces sp. CMB-StM0423]AUH40943.1 hypothetical protein CXR04_12365 [Streptomyces sp. CMB-StM0423]
MRIRTLARSLAASALVIGLAGVGAASAQATSHPKHDKQCCSKWFNQEISKKINTEVHKKWNKTEVEIDVDNNINNRVSGNKYTEINPTASVQFGSQQSHNREAIVIGR